MIRVGTAGRHPQPVDVPAPERPPLWGRDAITDHTFEPYPFDWPTCSHVELVGGVGRPCDQRATEHAGV